MSNKIDNTELPYSVKKALSNHVLSKDYLMSDRELDNSWKSFCNLLDADTQLAAQSEIKENFIYKTLSFLFRPAFAITAVSTASLLFALLSYNVNKSNSNTTAYMNHNSLYTFDSVNEKENRIADLRNEPRDYKLPQGDHFSELVTFVEQEHRVVPNQQKSMLDQKLSAELENSLRESMYIENSELEKSWGYANRQGSHNAASVSFVSYDR